MNRAATIDILRAHKAHLVREFGVIELALFGSTARDEAERDSDVDILIRFDGPATSRRYFGVQFYLEDLLDRPVALITDKAHRQELRPYIERDAVNV